MKTAVNDEEAFYLTLEDCKYNIVIFKGEKVYFFLFNLGGL